MTALGARWSLLRDLLVACGALPCAAVLAGGVSLGYAVWHASFARAGGFAGATTFAALAIVGVAVAAFAWLWPCARAASRNAVPLVAVLRYDAVAYGALVAYPIAALGRPDGTGAATGALVAALGYAAGSIVTIARFSPGFRQTLLAFGLSRIAVFAIAELAAVFVGDRGHVRLHGDGAWLEVWTRWDGEHYLAIAREGYHGSNLAFFPLYPVAIRLLERAFGNPILAAIVISNLSLLVALAYLRKLAAERFDDAVAARTLLYLVSFPTAVFFSAAYSESTFLALSVATFFYLRRGNWLLAGFLGGLAALTRVEGVLLIVPYAMEAIAHRRNARHARFPSLDTLRGAPTVGAFMILFGLLTFMLLSTLLSGDPLHFAHVQSHWKRHPTWPWTSIAQSIHEIATSADVPTVAVQSIELAFATLAVGLIALGARLLPPSMTVYAALSLLMPLFTGSLMSTQRFTLVLFPIFIVLGVYGRRAAVNLTILGISLPLLGAFTLLYAAEYWIG